MTDRGYVYINNKLKEEGFLTYVVGGAVRDDIIGKHSFDIDITTDATPEEIQRVFKGKRLILAGVKHGTVGVVLNKRVYEITTFREDEDYLDHRHPNGVKFVKDINTDLSRRDFTINAIAYSLDFGYIDPFCGREDIKNKIIRCVGNPDKRFNEDALRIMRALRFSSQLGFTIEENTKNSILRNYCLLKDIAVERIFTEFKKLLLGKNAYQILKEYREVFGFIMPEIVPCFDFDQKTPFHRYDIYEHLLQSVKHAKKDIVIKLSAYFHDIGKPNCFTIDQNGRGHGYGHHKESAILAGNILKRFKVDNDTYFNVVKLIEYHDYVIKENKPSVKKLLSRLGDNLFLSLLSLKTADAMAHAEEVKIERLNQIKNIKNIFSEIKKNKECYSLKKLEVSGKDVLSLGVKGKLVGDILAYLLEEVIYERLLNDKKILMDAINEYIGK